MSIDWWAAMWLAIGFLAGIAATLVAYAVIRSMRTLPMDGRTYTGPLHDSDAGETPTGVVRQLLRDANKQGDDQ